MDNEVAFIHCSAEEFLWESQMGSENAGFTISPQKTWERNTEVILAGLLFSTAIPNRPDIDDFRPEFHYVLEAVLTIVRELRELSVPPADIVSILNSISFALQQALQNQLAVPIHTTSGWNFHFPADVPLPDATCFFLKDIQPWRDFLGLLALKGFSSFIQAYVQSAGNG